MLDRISPIVYSNITFLNFENTNSKDSDNIGNSDNKFEKEKIEINSNIKILYDEYSEIFSIIDNESIRLYNKKGNNCIRKIPIILDKSKVDRVVTDIGINNLIVNLESKTLLIIDLKTLKVVDMINHDLTSLIGMFIFSNSNNFFKFCLVSSDKIEIFKVNIKLTNECTKLEKQIFVKNNMLNNYFFYDKHYMILLVCKKINNQTKPRSFSIFNIFDSTKEDKNICHFSFYAMFSDDYKSFNYEYELISNVKSKIENQIGLSESKYINNEIISNTKSLKLSKSSLTLSKTVKNDASNKKAEVKEFDINDNYNQSMKISNDNLKNKKIPNSETKETSNIIDFGNSDINFNYNLKSSKFEVNSNENFKSSQFFLEVIYYKLFLICLNFEEKQIQLNLISSFDPRNIRRFSDFKISVSKNSTLQFLDNLIIVHDFDNYSSFVIDIQNDKKDQLFSKHF